MSSQDVPVYCFENCVGMLVLDCHVIEGRGNNLDELNNFHHQLLQFVEEDTNSLRKSNCLNIMPKLKHITQTISFIRNCNLETDQDCLTEHLKALNSSIAFLVTESSNKEALQAIILLGGIECVCDLLVIIVSKLYPTFDCKENKLLRQYIAVALTNLSYKNSWIKQKICTYPGLVVSIRAIIADCPTISKVYSSLIRNLSWKSTERSIDKLCETIGPLVRATSLCYQKKDTKGLLCCLGALWNLSNHSTEAHRLMCREDHCLELLITLLKLNINYATIIEATTGILRSLSKYIVTNPVVMAFVERHNILPYLMKVAEKAALDIAAGKNVSDIGKQVVSNMIGCMNGDQKKVFTTFSMTLVMLFGVNGTNNFINTAIEVVSNNCKAFFTQCQQKVQALASQEQDYETIKEQAYGWTNTFLSETTIHLIMCRFKDRFISSDWAKIRGPLLKLVTKYDDTCGS
uniref:HEAT repeat-containing protein 6 n=1 Tax=Rhabditophanes sp. KR3021 TaxID=114890 RepID=A0AC35TQX9_9BILA